MVRKKIDREKVALGEGAISGVMVPVMAMNNMEMMEEGVER